MDILYICIIGGACGGIFRAIVGFAGDLGVKPFNKLHFIRSIILNTVFGAVAGLLVKDLKTAIISGLLGEEVVKSSVKQYLNLTKKNGSNKGTGEEVRGNRTSTTISLFF